MQIRYHTTKGSTYTHTVEGTQDHWVQEDKEGASHSLVEGLHISKKKLQILLRDYPSTVLDKTYCFDDRVEKQFFEDVKREHVDALFESEETVILFVVKSESGLYRIGCSSPVVKIEKVE